MRVDFLPIPHLYCLYSAKFYLPGPDEYALAITCNDVEEALYEEALTRGQQYAYRPDVEKLAGRYFVLTQD